MDYKQKERIVNIVFAIIFILTVLAAILLFVYGLIDRNVSEYNFDDNKDKLDYYFNFGFISVIFMLIPIFVFEFDLFFDFRYFVQPKSYRSAFKTVLNAVLCILSCMAVFLTVFVMLTNNTDSILSLYFYYLCAYILLRIIYVIWSLVLNRRERKFYLDA